MKLSVFYHHVRDAAAECRVSVPDMLSYVKSIGIDALEIDASDFQENAEEFYELMQKAGLQASNICCFYQWQTNPADLRDDLQIRVAKALHCSTIMPIPGLYTSDAKRPEELQNMLSGMQNLAARTKEEGLQICIEDFDHELSPIATMEGMKYFTDRVNGLKVAFDTGNFLYSEQDALLAYDLLRDDIIHMHLKDRALDERPGGVKKTIHGRTLYPCAVGDGVIPIAELVSAQEKRGYLGYYTIEHYDGINMKELMTNSAAYLQSLSAPVQ